MQVPMPRFLMPLLLALGLAAAGAAGIAAFNAADEPERALPFEQVYHKGQPHGNG